MSCSSMTRVWCASASPTTSSAPPPSWARPRGGRGGRGGRRCRRAERSSRPPSRPSVVTAPLSPRCSAIRVVPRSVARPRCGCAAPRAGASPPPTSPRSPPPNFEAFSRTETEKASKFGRERGDEGVGRGDGAEDAALHLDHLQGGEVVVVIGGASAILEQQALVAAVVGLAHGGVDTDVGCDAGEHQVGDAGGPQAQVEVGGIERAFT